ncbi:MAG: hypothetical protein DDT34_01556 [Firmicutes bacterium]|nr:hypothetical protein [Bacillota bacterium]
MHGALHQKVLREAVENEVAVVLAVALPGQVGNHIVFGVVGGASRGEWQHQGELILVGGGARQVHDDIVGLHGALLPTLLLAGDAPDVFFVVKGGGAGHMVGGEHLRLYGEELLWVANMPAQSGGHF